MISKAIPLAIMSDIDDFRKPYTVHNISAQTINDNVANDTPSFFLLTHIWNVWGIQAIKPNTPARMPTPSTNNTESTMRIVDFYYLFICHISYEELVRFRIEVLYQWV